MCNEMDDETGDETVGKDEIDFASLRQRLDAHVKGFIYGDPLPEMSDEELLQKLQEAKISGGKSTSTENKWSRKQWRHSIRLAGLPIDYICPMCKHVKTHSKQWVISEVGTICRVCHETIRKHIINEYKLTLIEFEDYLLSQLNIDNSRKIDFNLTGCDFEAFKTDCMCLNCTLLRFYWSIYDV